MLSRSHDQTWLVDALLRAAGPEALFPGSTGFRLERGYAYGDMADVAGRVKSLREHPREWGRLAGRRHEQAHEAEDGGHLRTAVENYHRASVYYARAQWSIFADTEEKRRLHRACVDSYENALRLTSQAERVSFTADGHTVYGIVHYPPGYAKAGSGELPAVLLVPGMDMTKEEYPPLTGDAFTSRGFLVLSIDGPGQGETRLDGFCVDKDNYDHAVSGAVDLLHTIDAVDRNRIATVGLSMGSYWAPKAAARDKRIQACVGALGCYMSKDIIFNAAQPTFRENYKFMAGLSTDEELDALAETMTLELVADEIACPVLLAMGSLDELCPVEDAEALFDMLACPKELWVYEGEFHSMGGAAVDLFPGMADWLHDALGGRMPPDHSRIRQR